MKKLYVFAFLGVILFHYSCGQGKTGINEKSKSSDPSNKSQRVDSIQAIPPATGWVNDFVHLFSASEIKSLDSLIGAYEEKTTIEFAIATIDSAMIGPRQFETYTLQMLRTWGVGKKEKNNGILIVIVPGLRRMRIENGYGIEKVLSDEETKAIIDSTILPYFKEHKFYEGTRAGILAMIKHFRERGYAPL